MWSKMWSRVWSLGVRGSEGVGKFRRRRRRIRSQLSQECFSESLE